MKLKRSYHIYQVMRYGCREEEYRGRKDGGQFFDEGGERLGQ